MVTSIESAGRCRNRKAAQSGKAKRCDLKTEDLVDEFPDQNFPAGHADPRFFQCSHFCFMIFERSIVHFFM